ncbi:SprT family protein [Streptococcus catagoni]|uniref:SprT family protein n=1 Tax=Streptococcus catagoni TaxID=2654874 RepID=UPI00140737D5|nr:SprT family protein [Streptococcus catagoni]
MQLNEFVKEVSLLDFARPFKHEAKWNKRLRTTGGRFFPEDGHLDFNPKIYEDYGIEVFRQIVRHELCHYHLFFEKKGYRHQDKDFKDLLTQVKGLRYAPNSKTRKKKIGYVCTKCDQNIYRQQRINTDKYLCGLCQGRIKEINQSKV